MNGKFPEDNLAVSRVVSIVKLDWWGLCFCIILFSLVMVIVKNHSYKIDLRNPSSHVLWHYCYSRVCFFLGERKAYLLVKGQSDNFVF